VNGTIDRRPDRNKQWRGRYTGPDYKQRSKSFMTKRETEKWLRDEISKLDRGTWTDPKGGMLRYGEHAEQWLNGLVGIRPKTRVGYESLLRCRVLPTFTNYQLRRIDPASVRTWIFDMVADGLSPSRIRQAHQVLRASMDQAVDDGLIGRNPAIGVKVPADRTREMLFLDAAQARHVAAIAGDHQPGADTLITFLTWSGLRWSEAVALRRSSLDLLRNRVTVSRAATEVGGRLVHGPTKTHRARTIIIPRSVSNLLAANMTTNEADGSVFTAPRGGPLRSSNFRRTVWLPAVATFAETYPHLTGLRIHDLRHTTASLAISTGGNIKAVQRMLGHKNASITLDRYGHLYDEDLMTLADRMDEKFREAA
jgi:integrase